MNFQFSQSTIATFFTICLFSISQQAVNAAPGNLAQTPLFVAAPVQPNIFFMLDDSGSMLWNLKTQGGSGGRISFSRYIINASSNKEWRTWCLGANALAYNSAITYSPWAANMPNTSTPYPDQTNLTSVWSEPITEGVGSIFAPLTVKNGDTGSVNLSSAPVVRWTDDNSNGVYNEGECAYSFSETRNRAVRADSLSLAEQINFANWFTYYRDRDRTVTAAVSQVIANSSARMGMATLHHNAGVGKAITDMTDPANKDALLQDIAKIRPDGGTPLRTRLNWVGEYFDTATSSAHSGLNIGPAPSPILPVSKGGECQQNFVMLMTDGQMNGGSAGVGHQDNNTSDEFVFNAHKDTRKDELADVAMKWYKKDLSASLDNKVPVQSGVSTQNLDENNKQHLVTFTVAFGLTDSLSDPVDRTIAFDWPENSLADMRHAAYNGRGQFLSAGNPDELVNALQNVISDIESRKGSASAVSFNTSTLLSNTSLFFASFDTIGWKGDVRAFTINQTTGVLSPSSTWSAATQLASKDITSRTIYTWGLDSTSAKDGVLFSWGTADPKPAANILADFKINTDTTVELSPFAESIKRLNYIRGNQTNDGVGLFRDRESLLGDIVHSAPLFVGAPNSSWPDSGDFGTPSKRYSTYQFDTQVLARDKVVYVGANDGLLHGFNASDGEEVLAYLPSAPASTLDNTGLHYYTEADYQHRYYVDGLAISADVYIPIEPAGTSDWRTILVGALGGGGRGLYALDVSKPADFNNTQAAAKDTVLWEYTDSDLGFSFSTPQITMMNNGEWAIVIGNGYNAAGTDHAKLKIIFIAKGLDGEWATDGDVITLEAGKGTSDDKNGLSTPSLIDLDGNGTTDRIYAGDLHGNMWVFDVSNATATSWNSAYLDSSSNPEPLFSATHYTGSSPATQVSTTAQPITMKPLLVKVDASWVADDPSTNKPNVMVYFGTGQYVATGDATNTKQQSFYGVWDAGAVVPASQLVEQTFVAGVPIDNRVLTQNTVTFPAPPTVPSTSSELGWFINLPESGERVIVNAFEHRGLIFFNTMKPSASPCSAGGSSWLMAVDMKNGGNPTIVAFDVNKDGNFDSLDLVSDGSNDHQVAGVKFSLDIASATSVITNVDGKSFAYTAGTGGDGAGTAGGGGISLDLRELPSSPVISGARRSWIQLFN